MAEEEGLNFTRSGIEKIYEKIVTAFSRLTSAASVQEAGTYYLVTPRGLMRSDDGVNWKLFTEEGG